MLRPEASVVVVHHRGLEHLLEALAALEAAYARRPDRRGPPRGQRLRRAPGRAPPPPSHGPPDRRPTERGFRRPAAAWAPRRPGPPSLLFVNDDAAVLPDAPRLLVPPSPAAEPDVVAVAGRLTDRDRPAQRLLRRFSDLRRARLRSTTSASRSTALAAAAPGEERLFACGGLMAVRRARVPRLGRLRRRLLRLPRGRRLRLAPVDLRAPHRRRAARRGAPPRRRDRGGARRLLAGLPLREERVRHGVQELRPRALPRRSCPRSSWRSSPASREMLAARNPGRGGARARPLRRQTPEPSLARRSSASPRSSPAESRLDDPLTHRPPARAALDPPQPRGRWPRSGGRVQARRQPLRRRDLREVSAAPRADLSRGRAIRLRLLRAVPRRARRSSSEGHARGDLRGRGVG